MSRTTIISNLITALKLINGTGGYTTDLNDCVYPWRVTPLMPEELPALSVRDVQDTIDPEEMSGGYAQWTHKLDIEIELIIETGSVGIEAVRTLITDIYKALGVDRTLTGACNAIYGVSDSIITPDDQNKNLIAGAKINIFALYQTDAFVS
jgi:hypothetical protein